MDAFDKVASQKNFVQELRSHWCEYTNVHVMLYQTTGPAYHVRQTDLDSLEVIEDSQYTDFNPALSYYLKCVRANYGEHDAPNDCPECARSYGPHYTGECRHA